MVTSHGLNIYSSCLKRMHKDIQCAGDFLIMKD
jgi:hypothetical protein